MVGGLLLLAFMSRRQVSMFVLIGGIVFAKLIVALIDKYDTKGTEQTMKAMTSIAGRIITLLLGIIVSFMLYRGKPNSPIIDESSYPVKACDYILENIDISTMRIFNEYNYGSYILYRGIPVFIDSRADLYTPEFNGKKNEEGKYVGKDIFSDCINISNISTYYEINLNNMELLMCL